MASPFDNMAGVLNSVFGASVTISYSDGRLGSARGILRDTPVEIELADGRIMQTTRPTLRLHRPVASRLKGGDRIRGDDKREYKVIVVYRAQSKAADALDYVELEEFKP